MWFIYAPSSLMELFFSICGILDHEQVGSATNSKTLLVNIKMK